MLRGKHEMTIAGTDIKVLVDFDAHRENQDPGDESDYSPYRIGMNMRFKVFAMRYQVHRSCTLQDPLPPDHDGGDEDDWERRSIAPYVLRVPSEEGADYEDIPIA